MVYGLIDQINHTSSGDFADGTIPFDDKALPYDGVKASALTLESVGLLKKAKYIEETLTEVYIDAWNDQFVLPLRMMTEMLKLCEDLFEAKEDSNKKEAASTQLQRLIEVANGGSKLRQFKDWHNITHARMHHPIPNVDILN